MLGVFFDLGRAIVRFCKFTVFCVAVLAICGCDQGQPTPPVPTPPTPTPDKQATTAVSAPDFAAMKKDAESGDATAQFNLGVMYQSGQGVPQDYADAMKWYRLAADQGDEDAQNNLGVMYAKGQGVPQDYAEAVKWFRLAADQGHAWAQDSLGVMYKNGDGVPQDFTEAYAWFSVAAAGGYPDATNKRDVAAGELTPEQLSEAKKRAAELLEKYGSGK